VRTSALSPRFSPASLRDRAAATAHTPFEQLEDRRVLAAVTYFSTQVGTTNWTIAVKYTDAQGINTSTLGSNDLRVTAPNGYNHLGTFQSFRQEVAGSDTSIIATYTFPARDRAWSFADNQTYTLAQEPTTVSDTTGEMVPAGTIRTFALWFSTPRAQVQGAFTTSNEFVANIRYSDNTGIDGATIGFGEVGLRRNTTGETTFVRTQNFFRNADGSWTATYRIPAVGGGWDYSDTGGYTLLLNGNQVRDLDSPSRAIPAQTLNTYNLWFSNPKVDYVSTSTSADDWIITLRYSDPQGVNLSTIGNGDIAYTFGGTTVQGVLASIGSSESTSVTVSYRLRPDRFAWGAAENGVYTVFVNQGAVTDSTGSPINRANIRTFNLFFDQPSISRPPSSSGVTSTGWTTSVTYTDNTGINLNTVGDGDLVAVGPNGYFSLATLVSRTTRTDAQGRIVVDATYRFARPIINGTYQIAVRANEVLDTNGRAVTSFRWATYNITL
jgi:hypothetical protein